jgi:superfamily II DNA or RNA helicase
MKNRIIVIAPPGSGKTTLEAKLSEAWMKASPGPVIVISRVKQLVSQVLSELVMINSLHPDRIACYSDADHEMDLMEPLAVGTIVDGEVEECIQECFDEKRNVYIGCVANAGSVSLLRWCLDKGYHVKVIADELAEIIPAAERDKEKGKENTLEMLYRLNDAGLLDYIAGFDAVWKTNVWRGMDDHKFWNNLNPVNGKAEPTILHTQNEMTYEKNVLCPVELIAVEIDEDELEVGDDESRKRQVEAAANIKILKHEEKLVQRGKKSSTKIVAFSSGSDAAKYCKNEVGHYNFDFTVDLNEFILAATNPDHRKAVQQKLSSSSTKIGIVFNYAIWTKGIDVQDLSAVSLGFERLPNSEILTHVIGRVTRRVPTERGLPVSELKIKPVGRFYVPYLRSQKQGGSDFNQVLEVYKNLYNNGYTEVNARILRDASTRKKKKPAEIENPGSDEELVDIFGSVEEEDVIKIEIGRAITAATMKAEQRKQETTDEDFRRVFAVRTDEEAVEHLKGLFDWSNHPEKNLFS